MRGRVFFASLAASALAYASLNCTGTDPDIEGSPSPTNDASTSNTDGSVDPTNDGGGGDADAGNDGAPPTPEGAYTWSFLASPPFSGAVAVAVDASGNVFFALRFEGTNVAFGGETLTAAARDIAVVKLTPDGKQVSWARKITGAGDEDVSAIAVDAAGDVYVAGTFGSGSATLDVAGQTAQHGAVTTDNAFVAKLSGSNGDGKWVNAFKTTASDAGASAGVEGGPLRVSSSGLYFAAYFRGDVSFTGGAASLPDRSGALIVRMDPATGTASVFQTLSSQLAGGNPELVKPNAIAVDATGNIYVAGQQNGTQLRLGGSAINLAMKKGYSSGFIVKLSPAMTAPPEWFRIFGPTSQPNGSASVRAMDVDPAPNAVYVTGTFSEACDFGYGNVGANDAGSTSGDAFIVRLDSVTGAPVWQNAFGGPSGDSPGGLAVDPWGRPFVTLNFQNVTSAVIDGKAIPSGQVFIVAKFDPTGGKAMYVTARASSNGIGAYGAASAPNGHAIVSGEFTQSITLEAPKTSTGISSIFVADLTP